MRFRFTIRDLLLVTAIIAMAIGWWLDRSRIDRQYVDLKIKYDKFAKAESRLDALLEIKDGFDRYPPGVYSTKRAKLPSEIMATRAELLQLRPK